MADTIRLMTWEWRKAEGGVTLGEDHWEGDTFVRVFHAYDVNDNAACEPSCGLVASCEEPNEGSPLCLKCIAVVQANPAGRDPR